MTLRRIECFLAVVREGTFTRAVERIHLWQPTLSEGVLDLERALGKPLLSRAHRQVRLTEAGRVFEPYAARVMATVEGGTQAVNELDGLRHGWLVVGASTTRGCTCCLDSSGGFARAIRASPSRSRSRTLAPSRSAGALGIWISAWWVATCSARASNAWLPASSMSCAVAMELDHTEAIKQAVMAGLGVALVSLHAVRGEVAARQLVALCVRGLRLRRHFHVIHDEGRPLSASAHTFARLLDRR